MLSVTGAPDAHLERVVVRVSDAPDVVVVPEVISGHVVVDESRIQSEARALKRRARRIGGSTEGKRLRKCVPVIFAARSAGLSRNKNAGLVQGEAKSGVPRVCGIHEQLMMTLGAQVTQTQNRLPRQLPLNGEEIVLRIRICVPRHGRRHARLRIVDADKLNARIRMARPGIERRKR